MIELKHLRSVQALRDTGSISEAASLLCLTQSALSHQLKELEHRLDRVLFERKSSPVQFTPAGELLLQLAAQVLPAIHQTEQQLQQNALAEQQVIRFCVECHACYHWLLPCIKAFQHQQPEVSLDFSSTIEHKAVEALIQGQLDLVVTSDQRLQQQVDYHYLYPMELRLLVSPDHALANTAWVEPAQLQRETIFSYPLPQQRQDLFRFFLADIEFHGQVKAIEQGSQMIQQVAANLGVAVLPSWMAEPYQQQGLISSISLGSAGLWRPMYLAYRLGDVHESIYLTLLQLLRQHLPQQQA
ncbi:MAG: LysR family transcriptional regulator [Alkalimonas sp.]|nr:LysR family transcriptional regulator [Alkalimonas sp.]